MRSKKIGLVIGSGGLKCAAAIGLWKVLVREGISIDLVVGCSGGSVYAGALAQGCSPDELEHATQELWNEKVFRRKRKRSLFQVLMPRTFGFDHQFGLIDDRALNHSLHSQYRDATIESLSLPLHIVATDLMTSEKVTLSSGPVWEAVRASVAIPFLIPPWEIDGRVLFDGGASDPLPIDVAIREGAEIIIAMGFESPLLPSIGSAIGLALQTGSVTVNHLLKSTYAFYNLAHHAEVIPIMPSFDRRVGVADVQMTPWIIEQGEIAAERELPYLKKILAQGETNVGRIA